MHTHDNGGNAVPDFADWGSCRLGHITVRAPTGEIQEEAEVGQGVEIGRAESRGEVNGVRYDSAYGVTGLNDATFEMRAFA